MQAISSRVPVALAFLSLLYFQFDNVATATIVAINESDTQSNFPYSPDRYDTTNSSLTSYAQLNSSSRFTKSLDYDDTTGNLYALTTNSSGFNAQVQRWERDGNFLGSFSIGNFGVSEGGDLSVHNGVISISRNDTVFGSANPIFRYTTTGASLGTLVPNGSHAIQSLDYDSTTGNLFAVSRRLGSGQPRLLSWDSGGTMLGEVALPSNFFPGFTSGQGTDITAHDDVVAINPNDFDRFSTDPVVRFTKDGVPLGPVQGTSASVNWFIQSIDFHAGTGDLYGLNRNGGGGLLSWGSNGQLLTPLSDPLGTPMGAGGTFNAGADIAVIPEASQLLCVTCAVSIFMLRRVPRLQISNLL